MVLREAANAIDSTGLGPAQPCVCTSRAGPGFHCYLLPQRDITPRILKAFFCWIYNFRILACGS